MIFIEPKRLYHAAKGEIADAPTPLYQARVVRPGRHVTVAGYGPTVTTLLESAKAAAEDGIELEVIDLRIGVAARHRRPCSSRCGAPAG